MAQAGKKWIAKFENLCAHDVTDDARMKAMLLHYIGEETYDIFDSFTNEQKGVGAVDADNHANEYAVAKTSLTDYFTPKKNTTYEVFKFRQTTQNPDENIDSFCTRLRTCVSFTTQRQKFSRKFYRDALLLAYDAKH